MMGIWAIDGHYPMIYYHSSSMAGSLAYDLLFEEL
jgi:hypothetical protein